MHPPVKSQCTVYISKLYKHHRQPTRVLKLYIRSTNAQINTANVMSLLSRHKRTEALSVPPSSPLCWPNSPLPYLPAEKFNFIHSQIPRIQNIHSTNNIKLGIYLVVMQVLTIAVKITYEVTNKCLYWKIRINRLHKWNFYVKINFKIQTCLFI